MSITDLCLRDLDDNGIENDQKVQTHTRGTEILGDVNDRPSKHNTTRQQIWME